MDLPFSPLPLFLGLPGEPPIPWSRWFESFETFLTAMGLDAASDARRKAMLLSSLGDEGQRVFRTLGPADSYNDCVALLTAHFAATQSVIVQRSVPRQRHQRPENCNHELDERRRLFMSNEGCFFWSDGELQYRTPAKKKNASPMPEVGIVSGLTSIDMESISETCSRGTPTPPTADSRWLHAAQERESLVKDQSSSTIRKQRRELQLMMMELKDREKELNAMAAGHHTQLQAWEQDHQRLLMLEQKCASSDEELQKRNDNIRILTKHAQVVESRESELQKELSEARRQLCELQKKQEDTRARCQDYEEKNHSLNSTVMALSCQVSSLQGRVEELSSMLKRKDKDMTESNRRILELSGHLQDLETALKESRSQESKLFRDSEDSERRYQEARHEAAQVKDELQQQVTQSSSHREEMIRLKQELQLLRRDLVLTGTSHLVFTGEGDTWKDELLELSRSKQDRLTTELSCLRQIATNFKEHTATYCTRVCENQRKDLELLRFHQEKTREAQRERNGQGFHGSSQDDATCSYVDHLSPSPSPSPRPKSFRSAHEGRPPSVSVGELGSYSSHMADGDDLMARRSLDETMLIDRNLSRQCSSVEHAGPSVSCSATENISFIQDPESPPPPSDFHSDDEE
ncbi:coiled-coil domain-containing protein 62 [Cololabis saira]|uniref:coiled-coil domain-containing protein 62 n=1 Tax=Cololabis saira TaxID=129043 RepID=UPI002AD1EF5D|nr:coiled-coil domain-containing protein 62 [Cololabis saira]